MITSVLLYSLSSWFCNSYVVLFYSFFCLKSLPSFLSYSKSPTYLLFCPMLALVLGSLAVLLLLFMLSLAPFHVASITLRILKQVLSDRRLYCYSMNFVEFFCLFPFFDLFPNKTNNKQVFNKVFINCCLFASNHAWKKIDLSFLKYGCLVTFKLNQLW